MNHIKAMKQALEALESSEHLVLKAYQDNKKPKDLYNQLYVHRDAVTDLRQAIAEAEKQEPVAVYGYCPECGAKGVMRERRPNGNDKCSNGHVYPSSKSIHPQPAQPKAEQEPVAWRYTNAKGVFRYIKHRHDLDMAKDFAALDPLPLYAHPQPSVQWQPIETAPRYGRILVRGTDVGVCVASAGWDTETPDTIRWEVINGITVTPKHWMPLPAFAAPPVTPVQEPVTEAQERAAFELFWVTEVGDKDDLTYGGLGYAINRVAVAWEAWKAAAQPKREWVGLTDEDIEVAIDSVEDNDFYDCVVPLSRAIEAKLKEKNA